MRLYKSWTSTLTLAALIGIFHAQAAAAPAPESGAIIVTRAAHVMNGGGWDVTVPASAAGHVFDQVWLVVDGKREGFGGGYFPYWGKTRTARLYANISNDLDGQVKDILKAQGFPVKPDVTVYRLSYSVNSPVAETGSKSLHFRHSASVFINNQVNLPAMALYKVGDMIPLFDAVVLDTDIGALQVFDPKDPQRHVRPGLPTDLVHEIKIQVQFVRTGPDHMPLRSPSSAH